LLYNIFENLSSHDDQTDVYQTQSTVAYTQENLPLDFIYSKH